jgi:glutaconate CoA-transferase subunit A
VTSNPKYESRASKVAALEDMIRPIASEATIVVGGALSYGVPMSAIRELARQGRRDLQFVTFTQGFAAELLFASGTAAQLIRNFVDLERVGLPPTIRRAEHDPRIHEWESIGLSFALMAAAAGSPFAVLPSGIEHTSFGDSNTFPQYQYVNSPYDGATYLTVPALAPDYAILHVQEADAFGNCRHKGFVLWDDLYAFASTRVLITCERLIDNSVVRAEPEKTTIPGYLVDAVAPVPGGAYPCASEGDYPADWAHIGTYVNAVNEMGDPAVRDYVDSFRAMSEAHYLAARHPLDQVRGH